MANADEIERMAQVVLRSQANSLQRDILGLWTIFDHPRDRPLCSFVARKCEVGGKTAAPVITDEILEAFGDDGLAVLRAVFVRAGLVCLPREPQDQPNIVETWV